MNKLAPGDKAPTFTLPGQDGKKVKRTDFTGNKLFLYFYPKANTPG
jgi:peroxiredoxin Q/BCP